MEYRTLGDSGLMVSELALGAMIFGEETERSTPAAEAEALIGHFLDAGGNHIDTANVYANGRSEEIVGKAIMGKRDQVVLATKVRFATGEGPNDLGLSRYHIMNSVEQSLRRLDVGTIDLLYMHAWDPVTPLDESLRAFDDLVRDGKVRYIGVSNFTAWQLMKALCVSDIHGWVRFIAAQYQYSLVVRDIEQEFLELCEREGVGLTPWGPLGGGFLSGKYSPGERPEDAGTGRIAVTPDEWEESWSKRATEQNWRILEAVDEIARDHNATHSQISLAWLLTRPAVSSVIVGVRTMEQLEDNLGAVEIELSNDEVSRLDAVSAVPPDYPYRMINGAPR